RRVAERTRELSALYDVTAVASASLDLETIMRRSLERIVTMMGSTIGLIQLVDEKSGRLWLAAAYGATDDTLSQLNGSPHLQDLASTVLNPGLPVVIADLTTDSRTAGVAAALGVHSYAGVPLRAKGQNRGVLNLARHRSRPFRIEEVALLASVADQVGVAAEHARLFKTVQDQAALDERQRLARELHDSVTQSLYSLTLLAEAARRLAVTGDLTRVAEYVGRLGEISQQALKEMRLLVYELRPPALEREGLVGALQQRLEAVEQRAGATARLHVEGSVELPPRLEEGLYRIAQEALNNALKHASATDVSVVLRADHESVDLEVMDNGTGFDLTTLNSRGGLGLATMRERAEQLGGRLHICTQPGEGTRVQLHTDCSNG
ncbi:MAG: GAF domain-containing sensor histidine kinase, partial [Chloroflexi bacterium]|nr:GAF domain-containing sensor histidine kinase [Chloroflexota bacterium]